MFNRNPNSRQLYQLESQGQRYLYNEQIEQALDSFEEGLKLVEQSASYCHELSFRYLITQTHVYYTYDQKAAVDLAVRLVSRLQRPEYENCRTQRIRIYDILIHAYFYRDCLGYEQDIRDSMDYLENNLLGSRSFFTLETVLRMAYIRAELDYENGDYESARNRVMDYISKAEHAHVFRQSDGYMVGRRVMYALGELALAYKYAELNAQTSRQGGYQRGVADALLWQGLFAKRLGDDTDAQRLIQQGLNHYEQYSITRTLNYFDSLSQYYELCNEQEQAQKLLEQQFEELPARGSLHDLAIAHLQYCRFLGRTEQSIGSAIYNAREFFQTLPKPEIHEPTLKRIEAGDYYQFTWQRP